MDYSHPSISYTYFSTITRLIASSTRLLPTYPALSFINELPGGSTRPWAVFVLGANSKPQKYAVKLFRDYHFNQYPAVANEVFGAVLANEFDLSSPGLALIEFSPAFVSALPATQQQQLRAVPAGLKIGSVFLEGNYTSSPALVTRALEVYDQETIYAFDNLILNVDRRPDKPNILLSASEAHLIDHEMAFTVADSTMKQLRNQQWEHNYRGHLFYAYLRTCVPAYLRARGVGKIKSSFHTFGQYLAGMQPARLEPYQRQLEDLGYGFPTFDMLFRYLCYQKANASQFEELLRRTLL
jgi:hypothetical protein